jgi:hypothetical protein
MDTPRLNVQRYAAESMHALFLFTQVTFNTFAAKTGF